MYRREMYNEGFFYQPLCVDRFAVVPGETVELDASIRWLTAAFPKPIMSGGTFSVAAFYVPYRLIWDQWVDFLCHGDIGENGAGGVTNQPAQSIPTTVVPWAAIFENASAARAANIFGRRAWKLIQNQYYGDVNFTGSFYSDAQLVDDNYVTDKYARNIDQFLSRLVLALDADNETLTYNVVSNQVTVDLNVLRRELTSAKSMRRRDMTGDKYVDALMRMGVKLDWRVQQAPECLGVWKGEVGVYNTNSQETVGTGKLVSSLKGSVHVKSGKKFFAEHGIVMLALVVKPSLQIADGDTGLAYHVAPDAWVNSKSGIFLGDNQSGLSVTSAEYVEPGVGNVTFPKFDTLRYGKNGIGRASPNPFCLTHLPGTFDGAVYPPAFFNAAGADQLDQMFASMSHVRHNVRLPFSGNII